MALTQIFSFVGNYELILFKILLNKTYFIFYFIINLFYIKNILFKILFKILISTERIFPKVIIFLSLAKQHRRKKIYGREIMGF